MPILVFTLEDDPATYERPYEGHFRAEAVLMQTLLDMGHVMSQVATWDVRER